VTFRYLLDTSIVSAPIAKMPNPEIVKRLEQHGQGFRALHGPRSRELGAESIKLKAES
jgi:hypothetical protein